MESLSRWREGVAFILAAVLGVRTAVLLVSFAISIDPGALAPGEPSRLKVATGVFSAELVEPLLTVVLTGVVLLCAYGRTRRTRQLTMLALVVSGISVLGAVVLAVINLALGGVFSFGLLAKLALPVLAIAVLARLAGATSPVTAVDEIPAPVLVEPAPVEVEVEASPVEEVAEVVRQEPGWLPDEASGAAWHSASAAASGAAATGWGRPGEPAGWDPAPNGLTDDQIPSQQPLQPHQSRASHRDLSHPD